MSSFALVAAFAVLLATAALAEPLPVPKPPGPGGSCPHGWTSSGSYCVPSQGAQDAIPKPPNGTCQWGWIASGSYCLRSGRRGNGSIKRFALSRDKRFRAISSSLQCRDPHRFPPASVTTANNAAA